jgi:hypothetical protein
MKGGTGSVTILCVRLLQKAAQYARNALILCDAAGRAGIGALYIAPTKNAATPLWRNTADIVMWQDDPVISWIAQVLPTLALD